jgi:ElaB/YqjD/DUF883 family membrane-anchored ribosome-binding protein
MAAAKPITTLEIATVLHFTRSNVSNLALGQIVDGVDAVRGAAPALNRIATDADKLARRGINAVRQSSEHLRGQATRAGVTMVRYIDDEPFKAVLIAAAAGAALMALRNLTSRG